MDYLCGVPVSSFSAVPADFTRLRLAAQRYAVFWHAAHVSALRASCNAIWNGWLPHCGCQVADAPILEHYDSRFDPMSGHGGIKLWVPLR